MSHKKLLLLGLCTSIAWAADPPSQEISNKINLDLRLKTIEERLEVLEKKAQEMTVTASDPKSIALSSEELLAWSTKSIEDIYSYGFDNAKQVLTSIRRYFTTPGYDSYLKALDESKNLKAVEEQKLVASAKVNGDGKILKEGDVNGTYTWEVELPVSVTYKSAAHTIKQDLIVTLEIVREKVSKNPQGIGINSITARVAPVVKPGTQSASGATATPPTSTPTAPPTAPTTAAPATAAPATAAPTAPAPTSAPSAKKP